MGNANIAMILKLSWTKMLHSEKFRHNSMFHLKMLRKIQRISRYFEGAVVLLFQVEPTQHGFGWTEYLHQGLFTAAEIKELQAQSSLMPESVFTWIAEDIEQMAREGFFLDKGTEARTTMMMTRLLFSARDASGCIATFLGAYLPFLYRHFASILVKFSNILLCMSSSPATGDLVADFLDCVIALIAVATFNTLVLVSHHLQDPFSNAFCAFPGARWRLAVAREFETQMRMNLAKTAESLERAAKEQRLMVDDDKIDESTKGLGAGYKPKDYTDDDEDVDGYMDDYMDDVGDMQAAGIF